jgi:UDP-N-acetylglucosamine--N-acetylmuramyl-(pentapeptide) pyrophosphoryl-undecaprenol N-acetylglucosamine transferase
MNIAFTGWGSGGHITPIASLIEYGLQDTEIASQCKLFRFGEAHSMEAKACAQFDEVTFVAIPAGKLRRYRWAKALVQNIHDLRKWIQGIFTAGYQLNKHGITHVFCKWGHVALPVCIAAYVLRIPISIHESDTYAGMTNRLAAKMARNKFVWFPGVLSPSKVIWQLLSPRLLTPDEEFLPQLQDISAPIVLVMWGSQGAARLFSRLLQYLETGLATQFHFVVLLWSKNEDYKERFSAFSNVTSCGFISNPEQMACVYQYTDISITRGSATSLAEQHCFGIRKIIVPTPYTWGNHQWYNGLRYRDTYGDILIEQNDSLDSSLSTALDASKGLKKTNTTPDKLFLEKPLRTVWTSMLSI